MTKCQEAALDLLALGYRPLAVDPKTKAPWYAWKQYQTEPPTPDEIEAWFVAKPDAGVGITTNGLLVVDIDGTNNDWPGELRADFMGAPHAKTPRGEHFYFKQNGGIYRNTAGLLAEGVDTRADGGFIVLPPTRRTDGGVYEWLGDGLNCRPDELAFPPQWIEAALKSTKAAGVDLFDAFTQPIPEGSRNATYYTMCRDLRDSGWDEDGLRTFLRTHNGIYKCGLNEAEIRKIAKSACSRPMGEVVNLDGLFAPAKSPKVLTMEDLEGRPAPAWLIQDLIPDRGFGLIVGAPGSGKSLFCLALANAVSRGAPLMGGDCTPNRTGWVLVLLPESVASWSARSRAFNDKFGLAPTKEFAAVIDGVNFADRKAIGALVGLVESEIERRGSLPAMILLDTLSAAIPGLDENSQASVTPLVATLQGWVSRGITVIATHHPSKSGSAYRGSSVLMGACDWMLGINKEENRRELVMHKLRDAEEIKDAAFEIVSHGGSAVAVAAAGPSELFMEMATPGLRSSWLDHGFVFPGGEARCPVRGLSIKNGVTLMDIFQTWAENCPVEPSRAQDESSYDKARKDRIRRLTKVARLMERAGYILVDGDLSRDSLKPIVRQPGSISPSSHPTGV